MPAPSVAQQDRTDGIEQDVAEDGGQVVVLVNRETLETALPPAPL